MSNNTKCPICGCNMEYNVSESGLKEYNCVSCQYSYEVKEKYKVTVEDLYIELKKLVENGDGDKPVKLSVNWDNWDYIKDLRAFSTDFDSWILLMGYD